MTTVLRGHVTNEARRRPCPRRRGHRTEDSFLKPSRKIIFRSLLTAMGDLEGIVLRAVHRSLQALEKVVRVGWLGIRRRRAVTFSDRFAHSVTGQCLEPS